MQNHIYIDGYALRGVTMVMLLASCMHYLLVLVPCSDALLKGLAGLESAGVPYSIWYSLFNVDTALVGWC